MTGLPLSETTPDATILDVDLSGVEMTRLSALYLAINTAKDVLAVHCATSSGAVEDLLGVRGRTAQLHAGGGAGGGNTPPAE
ncbi:hypothetical protein [Chelatococcus asaccharovorans]|uniref:Uncharacterized protein n=1 Tax=Chelatococcus asaccharovorans TaxID=28210 RepID=A0A2V3U1I5_9HYPH|nr:hypothetical protein [Chelatococcus asaccharovorans]MBS7702446.1 hypothetical protein [Chelatococcus asaccharovorans]PXW56346.1 hypothetical protein C7450_10896 [Chelatococcus asaccharovorans]